MLNAELASTHQNSWQRWLWAAGWVGWVQLICVKEVRVVKEDGKEQTERTLFVLRLHQLISVRLAL